MDGLTLERQVELLGDVTHNHSIEIDQLYADCDKAWGLCNDGFESLGNLYSAQAKQIAELSSDVGMLGFWTGFGLTALAAVTYFGYKKIKKQDERLDNLDGRCNLLADKLVGKIEDLDADFNEVK